MFIFGLAETGGGFDPLILLLAALLVEAYVGDARFIFRFVPHPVVLIGRLVDWFDRKLNRESRPEMDRAVRGMIAVLVVVAVTGAIGWGVAWLSRNHPWGGIVEFFGLIALIAQRSLYNAVAKVRRALDDEGLEAGRREVAHIVGRDPTQLDRHGVARAATESLAENFSDAVVAPVFWYVLFGFPGLVVYKAVNTMDSMIGHRSPRYRAFGLVAARLDDVLNLIPARLAALFLMFAALFVPKSNPLGALKAVLRDSGKHRSFNAGWPEAATAGALGIALAGPRRYAEGVVQDAWMGDGTARVTTAHMRRALYLYAVACFLNFAFVTALVVVRYAA